MRNKRGFTLIEILVVLIIIGVTLGFALLAFGDFGGKRKVLVAAEEFVNFAQLVRQQAIVESSTLGLSIHNNRYQALRYENKGGWHTLPAKGIFHVRYFPNASNVILEGGRSQSPSIIFNSTGEITPFRLHMNSSNNVRLVTVFGQYDGTIALQKSEKF